MKSLRVLCLSLLLTATTHAQTNAPAPAAAKVDDAVAKLDADTQTKDAPKSTKPYPVTAIVVSNTITFPILLSKSETPLMTNAVYRRTFGRKVIFAADLALQSFDIDKLHPSVLAQLDLDTNKVKADQAALDKANQDWAAANAQKNQQFLANEANALAKSQADAAAAASNNAARTPNPRAPPAGAGGTKTHHKKGTAPTTPPPAN